MAEVPPIQKTVDPKLSMTSAEQALELERAFDETFGPLGDAHPETQPPPTQAGAAPETLVEETPPPEEGEPQEGEPLPVEAAPAVPAGHPDDEPDDEIDKFKLHPETRPESLHVFRELRGMLKNERKKTYQLEQEMKKREATQSPRSVSDPEVQKEIEELRTFRQRHQILDDSAYQSVYENPVHDQFNAIIEDIKGISNDAQAAADWEKQMRATGPDRLGKQYWNEGVISQIADPLDRDRLVRKVSTLMELQDKRNAFRKQVQEEPDAYAKFQHQQAAEYWDNFGREAEDEMKKVTPQLGEWAAPRDVRSAKNATEKTAIEAHNATYQQYEELFKRYISDAATSGPRGMARVSALAVYGEKRRRDLEAAQKKIAKLEAENAKQREELTKIAGARSRVAQPSSAASNGAPAPAAKRKASQSVDDAFKQHFGI